MECTGDDSGAHRSAGQQCPALKGISGAEEEGRGEKGEVREAERRAEEPKLGLPGAPYQEVTAEEGAAIIQFLKEPGAPGAAAGPTATLVRTALKIAGALLVAAGVGVGLGDGNELDDVGCSVARQPGGTSHRVHSGQSKEGADDKTPDCGGGSGGGAGNGGPGGGPPCEVRAERCLSVIMEVWRQQCQLMEWVGGMVGKLAGMGRDVAEVAKGNFELRKENSELRGLQSDGMFKFALRVDPVDFQAFAAIMALGNRKAAAELLRVPVRRFYERVERWPGRGRDYARMARMVEWRKVTDRKMVVRLEDSLLSGGTDVAENPETLGAVLASLNERDRGGFQEILRQVLEALREQDANNWAGVRDELVGILKEEAG